MNGYLLGEEIKITINKNELSNTSLKIGQKLKLVYKANSIELVPDVPAKSMKGAFEGLDTNVNREGDRL